MGTLPAPDTSTWILRVLLSIPALFVVWIIYKVLIDMRSPLRKIPGPPGSLLLGNLAQMRVHHDFLGMMVQWSEQYGGIFVFRPLPGRSVVYLSDMELVKHVLVTNHNKYFKPATYKRTIPLLDKSLLTSNGREHAQRRKMLMSAFDQSKLSGMTGAFRRVANALVENWSNQIRASATNYADVMASLDFNHYSLDLIGETALGYKFNTLSAGDSPVSRAFYSLIYGVSLGRSMWKTVRKYLPLEENRRRDEAARITRELVGKAIQAKRQQHRLGQPSDREEDFLDSFIELTDERTGKQMETEELQAQVLSLFVAGHENTSATLSWTLYELAKNPDLQAKVRQEASEVLGEADDVTLDTLERLKHTENVLKESMRMHPATHGIGRWSVQDDTLGQYVIPRKTFLIIGIHAIQNSPKYWTEPQSFNPDRFENLTSEQESIIRDILLPFSAGPRLCIGRNFVTANMKLVLATLLRRFSVSLVPGLTQVKNRIGAACKPCPSLRLRLSLVVDQSTGDQAEGSVTRCNISESCVQRHCEEGHDVDFSVAAVA